MILMRPGRVTPGGTGIFFLLLFCFISPLRLFAAGNGHLLRDTVRVPNGSYMIGIGRFVVIPKDTYYLRSNPLHNGEETENVNRSGRFYDTVYRRMSRKEFTKMLYHIAFVPPKTSELPVTSQGIASESPFEKYRGKIIRSIQIESLEPFGPTVMDPGARPLTGVGKALNNAHMTTRKYIIRKHLFFSAGDPVDPYELAENEKNLRDIPSIDNARILVSQPDPSSDSVDITVISKDVFSIGLDVVTLTGNRAVLRIFDANFLGLNHYLSNQVSMDVYRSPFLKYDGFSYFFPNIGGSFIDGIFRMDFNDENGQIYEGGLQRAFFSNRTRWAGGLNYSYNKNVNTINDTVRVTSFFDRFASWAGLAFPFRLDTKPTRVILSGTFFLRNYHSAPFTSPDTNRAYYDNMYFLVSLAYSRNNYFSTNYLLEFGHTENIPYGSLIQLDFGPERTSYYDRIYGSLLASGGVIVRKAGYLKGTVQISGFLNKGSFEDNIFKINGLYISPKLIPGYSRYIFRIFLEADYRLGFNFRKNNTDLTELSGILSISGTKDRSYISGTSSAGGLLTAMMYTPWYFYGFRFALFLHAKGGFVSDRPRELFEQHFDYGIGTGCRIKNENLAFPSLNFSFYFYPAKPGGTEGIQFGVSSGYTIRMQDFNFVPPSQASLHN